MYLALVDIMLCMTSSEERTLANLRKGTLEFCLLALLRNGEAYGWDIARTMSELGLLAGEGTVYPLLSRLRQSGQVTTRWDESDVGRARKYYAITDVGRESVRRFTTVWEPFSASVSSIVKEKP